MNLQLFAEDADEGQEDQGADVGKAADAEGKDKEEKEADPQIDIEAVIAKKLDEMRKADEENARKVDEAKRLGSMSDQEKQEHEVKQLKAELEKIKLEQARSEMLKSARKILSEKEMNLPDELVSVLVADNAEDTKAAIDRFVELFKGAVGEEVKKLMKGETPKGGSGKAPKITREEIDKITDGRLRLEMIQKNIDLYKER